MSEIHRAPTLPKAARYLKTCFQIYCPSRTAKREIERQRGRMPETNRAQAQGSTYPRHRVLSKTQPGFFKSFVSSPFVFPPPQTGKKKKQARELETMPPPLIEKQRMELEELELDQHSVTGISGDCGCSARPDSVAPIFRASFRSHKDKYNPSIPQRHQYAYKYFVRKSSRLG